MDNQINIIQTCYNFAGAKLAAKCFRIVAPHSTIKIRRKRKVYVLNRSSIAEQEKLLRFSIEVMKQIMERFYV